MCECAVLCFGIERSYQLVYYCRLDCLHCYSLIDVLVSEFMYFRLMCLLIVIIVAIKRFEMRFNPFQNLLINFDFNATEYFIFVSKQKPNDPNFFRTASLMF
jgi:hypothetical protein